MDQALWDHTTVRNVAYTDGFDRGTWPKTWQLPAMDTWTTISGALKWLTENSSPLDPGFKTPKPFSIISARALVFLGVDLSEH